MKESALYKSIIAEGEARAYADNIYKILIRELGSVDPALQQHIASIRNPDLLAKWHDAALDLNDAESARQLLDTIRQTPVPLPTTDAQRSL